MVDDFAGNEDGAAGRSVIGRDEERTLLEPRMAWLAAVSLAEARKET
jgi:hypothetical protein